MPLKRYVLTIFLIQAFFIPGAYGDIHVGVTGGSGIGGRGSVGLGVGANKDAAVTGSIVVNGASLVPTITISGICDLDENHLVTDSAQNHAEIHAKVVKGRNVQYSDTLTPGEGNLGSTTGSVQADQTLTVGDSKYIKCSQSASIPGGYEASDGIEINGGSLTNYHGIAQGFDIDYGEPFGVWKGAYAVQTFDNAQGKQITLRERSSDSLGNAITDARISDGCIISYYGESLARRIIDPDQTIADDVVVSPYFQSASVKEIEIKSSSSDVAGAKTSSAIGVKGKGDKDASIGLAGVASSFVGAYPAYPIAFDQIFQFFDLFPISGKEIHITSSASDNVGDKVSTSTSIKDGSSSEVGVGATASTTGGDSQSIFLGPFAVTGIDSINAAGKKLNLDATATNAEGFTLSNARKIDNPIIPNLYQNYASANSGTLSVVHP